jgi:hypothetical protein
VFNVKALIVCIVAAGVCGVAALDHRLPRDWTQPTRSYGDLRAELRNEVTLYTRIALAFFAAASLTTILVFLAVAALVGRPIPAAAIVVRPTQVLLALLGLPMGLAAMFLTGPFMRRRLKGRYSDFWFVVSRRPSPKVKPPSAREYLRERRLLTLLVPILATAALVGFCLALDSYVYVTPSEIVENPFLGFQEHHRRYADVAAVDTRFGGKHHNQLACTIRFADGTSFSTDAVAPGQKNAELEALAAYVVERSSAPWTRRQ